MIVLADQPKPTHGMSIANESIIKLMNSADFKIDVINTAPSYAANYFGKPSWTVIKAFHFIYVLMKLFYKLIFTNSSLVYRSLNGGFGQIYDLAYLLLLRVFNKQIVIHHHSFNYINNKSFIFSFICALIGRNGRHIVLSESMKLQMAVLYSLDVNDIYVIKNLAFFSIKYDFELRNKEQVLRIGHLANLSFEKGVKDYLEISSFLSNYIATATTLAGPCSTSEVEMYVKNAIDTSRGINYLGPVYNESKHKFYSNLDVFIFPSKYVNEAEPLVIYEAAQYGAFVIGTQRGCMAEQISSLNGYSYPEITDNIFVAEKILELANSGQFSSENRSKRIQLFKECQEQATNSLNILLNYFKDGYVPKIK
ncbi:glycosyltransferase family 4 protein [Shewanella vesiculosa]|uniref:glycosyltransferase family 4 protein n=1 Tax=Shewanella vesiculosa TaxID=518738 RepID=UPI00384B1634